MASTSYTVHAGILTALSSSYPTSHPKPLQPMDFPPSASHSYTTPPFRPLCPLDLLGPRPVASVPFSFPLDISPPFVAQSGQLSMFSLLYPLLSLPDAFGCTLPRSYNKILPSHSWEWTCSRFIRFLPGYSTGDSVLLWRTPMCRDESSPNDRATVNVH